MVYYRVHAQTRNQLKQALFLSVQCVYLYHYSTEHFFDTGSYDFTEKGLVHFSPTGNDDTLSTNDSQSVLASLTHNTFTEQFPKNNLKKTCIYVLF